MASASAASVASSGRGALRKRSLSRSISITSAWRVIAQKGRYPGSSTQCTGDSRRRSVVAAWNRSSCA